MQTPLTTAPASPPIGGGLTYALLKERLALPTDFNDADENLRAYVNSGLALLHRLTSLPVLQKTNTHIVDVTTGWLVINGQPSNDAIFGRVADGHYVIPAIGVIHLEVAYTADGVDVGGGGIVSRKAVGRATEIYLTDIPREAKRIEFIATCYIDIGAGIYTPLQDALVIYVRNRYDGRDYHTSGLPPAFHDIVGEFRE